MDDSQSANGQSNFNRQALHSRVAGFYRTQRKPKEQWKTITDLQPQLDEIRSCVQAREFETAATALFEIDFDYLFLWGNFRLLIELREQLEGNLPENSFLAMGQANNLGLAYFHIGRAHESIKQFEKHVKMAKLVNNTKGIVISLGNLGNVYHSLGDYGKAIKYYEQSLEISSKIGDRHSKGNSLGNLGLAYKNLGDYRKAIEYHQQALQISREIGSKLSEGQDLANVGNSYHGLGDYRKAIEYYQQSLKIKREIGDRRGEGTSLGNLGLAYHSLGNYQKAAEYYEQSIAILDAIESPLVDVFRCNLEILREAQGRNDV